VSANARELGFRGADVVAAPVATALAGGPRPGGPFDLVFSDPPYPLDEAALARDLTLLVDRGWLADEALVVVERSGRSPEPTWPAGLRPQREKKYGETRLWYAECAPSRDR
jgi:16S rRNA (guanine966-N2)-methyltransferase